MASCYFIILATLKNFWLIDWYLVRTEMLSTFSHTSRIHFLANKYVILLIQTNGAQMPKNPRNSPFSLRHVDPHLIHQCLGPPTHHSKQYPDPIGHFATVHFPDRQTDRLWSRRQARAMSAPLSMLMESDALIIKERLIWRTGNPSQLDYTTRNWNETAKRKCIEKYDKKKSIISGNWRFCKENGQKKLAGIVVHWA